MALTHKGHEQMINQSIILQGVEVDSFLEQVRQIIRAEVNNISKEEQLPAIGGLDLATKVTGLSKQSIYRHTCLGTMPFIKRGGRLYFKTVDLLRWIETGR